MLQVVDAPLMLSTWLGLHVVLPNGTYQGSACVPGCSAVVTGLADMEGPAGTLRVVVQVTGPPPRGSATGGAHALAAPSPSGPAMPSREHTLGSLLLVDTAALKFTVGAD